MAVAEILVLQTDDARWIVRGTILGRDRGFDNGSSALKAALGVAQETIKSGTGVQVILKEWSAPARIVFSQIERSPPIAAQFPTEELQQAKRAI